MDCSDYKQIKNAVNEILPFLKSRANEAEELRRLPADVVQSLKQTGVFSMSVPKSWGGPELTSMQQTKIIELIATVDAAISWCVMIGSDSGIYSGYLQENVAKKLFNRLDIITAGWLHPQGRAEKVEGGYVINGNWSFGSGSTHSDLLCAGCYIYKDGVKCLDEDNKPIWKIMITQSELYELKDGWFTTGLAASGSVDYSAQDLFIPEEQVFSFSDPVRKGPLHDSPESILRNMSGVPLGMARAAIDYVKSVASKKIDFNTDTAWVNSHKVQTIIAQSEIDLFTARSSVYSSLTEQWKTLESKQTLTTQERIMPALARYNAFQTSRKIISTIYDLVGGTSIYKNKSPMDKLLRDANTICQHAVAQEGIAQSCGELLLTGKTNNPFI